MISEEMFNRLRVALDGQHVLGREIVREFHGAVAVYLDNDIVIWATPGWEGDEDTLPVEINKGAYTDETIALPVEWTGDIDTDVRTYIDALSPIVLHYMKGSQS